MISLSIIVPVYQVEPYIAKCVASILESPLFDSACELIVVDDGSLDGSMEIVGHLCASRQNVTLIRQENQGLGMARNSGAAKANGEYLWFVDSDDWLPNGAIEKILALTEVTKPDVVNIDHVMSDGRRTTLDNCASGAVVYTGMEYLKMSCVQSPVQYYILRTAFYRAHFLRFEKGIYHEDALFTPTALFWARRVVRLAEDCYVYNVREGSIMTSGNNLKHARDMVTVVARLEAFRRLHASRFEESVVLAQYVARAVGGVFYYWRRLGKQDRRTVSAAIDIGRTLRPICLSGSLKYLVALSAMLVCRPLRTVGSSTREV